jgi:endonuclease/exonuclease/phosphatase family metal-dependent hydrolase
MASDKKTPKSRLLMSFCARVLGFVAVVGTLARALPTQFSDWPFMPEIVALMPWYVAVALLSFVLAFMSKRWFTALLSLACLLLGVSWQLPFFTAGHQPIKVVQSASSREQPVKNDLVARVMTANVYKGRARAEDIVNAVRDNRIEVLALQETTDSFVEKLNEAGIKEYLPYSKISSSDGIYGNGLWSLVPLGSPAKDDINSSASQMPAGTVSFGDSKQIRFISVHTTSPSVWQWKQWKRSIDELSVTKTHVYTRYVCMGDFNATYDHAPFREFLGQRFTDAALYSGHGFTMTWPADKPWIPAFASIDHIVVDQGIKAGQLKTVRIEGSDHYALVGTIWFED